ncbi:MAG: carboxypeptidase-like regulatory domain-containing protein [Candidatus Tectimicrobiota bacterium]
MRSTRALCWSVVAALTAVLLATPAWLSAQQPLAGPSLGNRDLGGVVTSANGPEAGVWVIAETTDLPTRFARIVVTDEQGRYLVPDLPEATYKVWVRGYGLVDSSPVESAPGRVLPLTAVVAPDAAAAAHYYPAIYWYAMLQIPEQTQFGGASAIPATLTQIDWLKQVKNIGCIGCHPLGQLSTRTLPASLGTFASHDEAWRRRILSGQAGEIMVRQLAETFGGAPFHYYAAWTERIAQGALPPDKPTRPQGLERNIVVTWWQWGTEKQYLHDLIASDRRYPTVNAYGMLFGSPEYSTDIMPILDPKTHRVTTFTMPVRDAHMPPALGPGHAASLKPLAPSPYWGSAQIWDTRANNHNGMFDKQGRVWFAASFRSVDNPAFCKQGSEHPSAMAFPLERSARQVTRLDPRTLQYTFVDTCFGTHHVQFGYDAQETLWLSGTGPVAGWINTVLFDETGDAAKAQGWSPFVLDTNGNGIRDAYVAPNQALDPSKDQRIVPGSNPATASFTPVHH